MADSIIFELVNIDREDKTFKRIELNDVSTDLSDYILKVRKSIIDEKESRVYELRSDSTEVYSSIKKIIENDTSLQVESEVIAQRLLNIEIDTQTRYDHIAKIKKGSLFVSKFQIEDIINVLVVKIEHSSFIDENDFKKHIGLPFENEVLKSCLFQFNLENELASIMAHDSNITISSYWWKTFLELNPLSSDEENTTLAFNALDNFLIKKIKGKSPSDYSLIRNNLIGYFKTRQSFSMTEMAEYVIGSYSPQSSEIDCGGIKKDMYELPQKKHFDSTFNIISSEIKARSKTIVKVNDEIELRILDHADDLISMIHGVIDDTGKKYLKILADDEAYERFNYGAK